MWTTGSFIKATNQFSAEKYETATCEWMESVQANAQKPEAFEAILTGAAKYIKALKSNNQGLTGSGARSGRAAVF